MIRFKLEYYVKGRKLKENRKNLDFYKTSDLNRKMQEKGMNTLEFQEDWRSNRDGVLEEVENPLSETKRRRQSMRLREMMRGMRIIRVLKLQKTGDLTIQ